MSKAGVLGDRISIRHHDYRAGSPVVSATASRSDAGSAISQGQRRHRRIRTAATPALNRPGVPGLLHALNASQPSNHNVKAVLVRVAAFPRYVLLEPGDAVRGFVIVMVVCTLASTLAIRAALKVDPATAIGG
jgi:hypothetical protein